MSPHDWTNKFSRRTPYDVSKDSLEIINLNNGTNNSFGKFYIKEFVLLIVL